MNEEKKDDKQKEEEKKSFDIDSEEDIIKMLNEIMNESDSEPKVIIKTDHTKTLTIKTFKNIFVDYIYNLIINMALILALCGWFKVIYSNRFYMLIIFAFLFGTIDYWIKTAIYKFYPTIFFRTFGYIFTLASTIIMAILGTVGYLFFDLELNSAWIIVGCYILFLVVRAVIITYIKRIK